MTRRVVITGAGVVSPIGLGSGAFWRACLAGRASVAAIPETWRRHCEYKSRFWAPLPDIDYEAHGYGRAHRTQHDPATLNALIAAREALDAAGLAVEVVDGRGRQSRLSGEDPEKAGVYLGTGVGGAHSFLENHYQPILGRRREALERLAAEPDLDARTAGRLTEITAQMFHLRRVNPFIVSMLMPNAAAAAIGNAYSLHGPNTAYCVACAAGTVALGHAFRSVRRGEVDLALAGGSEYLNDHYGYIFKGFDAAGTLALGDDAETVNRPFDAARTGFLYSEGASAVLVLEERGRALRRGAPILAEIAGYAESFDAHNMMSPAPDGVQIERMIRAAVGEAGAAPADIAYVNAHGTGTQVNDKVEAQVLERVFGRGACVSSTKSLTGHAIGASGALEALATALTVQNGIAHGTANLADPVLDLDFVTGARHGDYRLGLSESFAFGGHNAALVMRRHDD